MKASAFSDSAPGDAEEVAFGNTGEDIDDSAHQTRVSTLHSNEQESGEPARAGILLQSAGRTVFAA
jgi:hypothetical protein